MKIKVHEGMEITYTDNINDVKLIAVLGFTEGCTKCEVAKYIGILNCPFECNSFHFIKQKDMPYKVEYFTITCPFCGYPEDCEELIKKLVCPNCGKISKKPVNF